MGYITEMPVSSYATSFRKTFPSLLHHVHVQYQVYHHLNNHYTTIYCLTYVSTVIISQ